MSETSDASPGEGSISLVQSLCPEDLCSSIIVLLYPKELFSRHESQRRHLPKYLRNQIACMEANRQSGKLLLENRYKLERSSPKGIGKFLYPLQLIIRYISSDKLSLKLIL